MSLPDRKDLRVDGHPTGSRTCLVIALKHLVARHAYEVPAEDVADHIMRDALLLRSTPSRDD